MALLESRRGRRRGRTDLVPMGLEPTAMGVAVALSGGVRLELQQFSFTRDSPLKYSLPQIF